MLSRTLGVLLSLGLAGALLSGCGNLPTSRCSEASQTFTSGDVTKVDDAPRIVLALPGTWTQAGLDDVKRVRASIEIVCKGAGADAAMTVADQLQIMSTLGAGDVFVSSEQPVEIVSSAWPSEPLTADDEQIQSLVSSSGDNVTVKDITSNKDGYSIESISDGESDVVYLITRDDGRQLVLEVTQADSEGDTTFIERWNLTASYIEFVG